ncbi:ribonuclease s-3 [Quercus suber]|uniref:Ribonuclease s-3 n=1 Tax=Quercus suber TaxID=58331 RepID=A0AAW0JI07_QUESU
MKVFYVIVLVLVAGAVPSHGRTESEGTVFNKTQSHESMNNVTVSNIKLVPYGNSYLVMQWPRSPTVSLCMAYGHRQNQVEVLTAQIDAYTEIIHSSSVVSENNNERFWGTEYNKHGSCTFRNQNDYFELTLTVVEGLGISRIGGGRPIIIPGYYYWPIEIKRAVQKVTNKMPRLKCITVGTTIQLLEISFCVDQNGNVLDVCKGVLDCGNWKVYLPLP